MNVIVDWSASNGKQSEADKLKVEQEQGKRHLSAKGNQRKRLLSSADECVEDDYNHHDYYIEGGDGCIRKKAFDVKLINNKRKKSLPLTSISRSKFTSTSFVLSRQTNDEITTQLACEPLACRLNEQILIRSQEVDDENLVLLREAKVEQKLSKRMATKFEETKTETSTPTPTTTTKLTTTKTTISELKSRQQKANSFVRANAILIPILCLLLQISFPFQAIQGKLFMILVL